MLTRTQRQAQNALKKEIESVKQAAKERTRGIEHKYIKHATRDLEELYKKPRFRDNHNFLLRRYAELEKKNPIWTNLCIPALLTFLPAYYLKVYKQLIEDAKMVQTASTQASNMNGDLCTLQISAVILLVVAFICLAASIFYLCTGVLESLTRKAETTIRENELYIIKRLLIYHRLFME